MSLSLGLKLGLRLVRLKSIVRLKIRFNNDKKSFGLLTLATAFYFSKIVLATVLGFN